MTYLLTVGLGAGDWRLGIGENEGDQRVLWWGVVKFKFLYVWFGRITKYT